MSFCMDNDYVSDDMFESAGKNKRRDDFGKGGILDDGEISTFVNGRLQDKITSMRRFLDDFQKRLEGYEYVSGFDKVTYTGRVLCGTETIQRLVSMLSPFAENSNLISDVKIEEYYREKYEINSTVNEMLLADIGVPVENQKTVLKMFKFTFKRIGNIVNTSRELMKSQFMQEDKPVRGDTF